MSEQLPSANHSERKGPGPAAKLPFSRGAWNVVASLWLAIVICLFAVIRVLGSSTFTHLLQRSASR